ncbi:MAG: hypothetical protein WC015_00850 [Methanoregula sp.]|jgi:hypothetical protein
MAKKEFPDKWVEPNIRPEPKGESKGSGKKASWIANKIFDVIKLILGLCLLPFVYSVTISFMDQIAYIELPLQNCFWAGVIALLLVYLFVWEPAVVYEKGHKLLEIIFSFFQPLVKVAPYLLPIYTVVIFILYLFLSVFIRQSWLIEYAMFLFGLTLSLHLVFAAKSIRSKKGDLLKSNYIFGFSFMYILNIGLISLFLNFIFKEFSFVNFSNSAYSIAGSVFKAIFSQLFVV